MIKLLRWKRYHLFVTYLFFYLKINLIKLKAFANTFECTSKELIGEDDEIIRITEAILTKQRKKEAAAVLEEEKNRKELEDS